MKKFNFKSIDDLCVDALFEYDSIQDSEDFYGVDIVARYDIIVEALNWFAENTIFSLYCINIEPPEIDWYADEYILSLQDDKLWCERAKNGDNYLMTENPTYVHTECNSKFIIKNSDNPMYEFTLSEYDDDCECDCCAHCNCEDHIVLSKDADGNTHGFTRSWGDENSYSSFSFYSTDTNLVRAELDKFSK